MSIVKMRFLIWIFAALLPFSAPLFGFDLQELSKRLEERLDWTFSGGGDLSAEDLNKLKELSAKSDPMADFALGVCKLRGIGLARDEAGALELFKRAAEADNPQAMNAYALCLKSGIACGRDSKKAEELFKKAAELGDLSAVASRGFKLALLKDERAAQTGILFLKSAADSQSARAMVLLGVCYEKGFGIDPDPKKAEELFLKAEEKGSKLAPFYRAELMTEKGGKNLESEIFNLYKISADAGYPDAIARIGACYMYAKGVEQNFELALKYLKLAADKNVAGAVNDLAVCYANSIGVPAESAAAESVKLFMKAAELGDAKAQNNLANYYYFGTVIAQDYERAFYWYSKSANQGNAAAQSTLALCYLEGLGVDKNPKIAVTWLRLAAEAGDVEAQSNLGKCFIDGIGTKVDYKEGVKWLKLAADARDSNALANLGACYYRGLGVEKNEALGKSLIRDAAKLGNKEAQEILRRLPEDL